jgi:potassium efflux system protein
MAAVSQVLQEEVSRLDTVIQGSAPQLIISAVGGDIIELKILVWIKDIYSEAKFKIQLLAALMKRFVGMELKLL